MFADGIQFPFMGTADALPISKITDPFMGTKL